MQKFFALLITVTCFSLLAACNKTTAPATSTSATAAAGSTAPLTAAADPAATAEPAAAEPASSIQLADGTQVPVIAASVLDSDPKAHAGLVAISGEVSQVFAEKGTFMLKDCPKDDDCKTTDSCSCCSTAEVPVRVELSAYDGGLPAVQQDVIVIAEVSPTETGYTLAVREVRQGAKSILTRKA